MSSGKCKNEGKLHADSTMVAKPHTWYSEEHLKSCKYVLKKLHES